MLLSILKCRIIYFFLFIVSISSFKLRQDKKRHYFCPNCQDEDKFLEESEAIEGVYQKASNLYKTKPKSFFSDIYTEVNPIDVVSSVSNLFKGGAPSRKSLRKIEAIIDNVPDGQDKLNFDPMLKASIAVILNSNTMNIDTRVNAAKIASRLGDVPVSIQITPENTNKPPKNADSFVILPRNGRLYRPDYYVENYKAGNWGA